MAAVTQCVRFWLPELRILFGYSKRKLCSSSVSGEDTPSEQKESKLGGFAEAFHRFEEIAVEKKLVSEAISFPTMLRRSKLMEIGDPEGRIVIGKIFRVVENDLYIDFGGKFHCVCTRPQKNGREYIRGAQVRVRLHSLELSSRFLGATRDLTVLEADATLLGLMRSTSSRPKPEQ